MDYNKYSFVTYIFLVLIFTISGVILLGSLIYELNKCNNDIPEQLCDTNINILMSYVKNNIKYTKIEIIFCYESMCNTATKTVSTEIYNNISNIACWYKIDNLQTLTIDNIKVECDNNLTILILSTIIICIIAFILIIQLYQYNDGYHLYLPLWYISCIDNIFGIDNSEKIIYEDDKLYQSGIQVK